MTAAALENLGRHDEAIMFYLRVAEAGRPEALREAWSILSRVRRRDEADRLQRYGIEPGGRIAAPWDLASPAHPLPGHGG